MKYLILIHSNPKSRAAWETFSSAERADGLAAYAALDEELAASGELIVSEALADPSQARLVTVRDGEPMATDGPFAEVKEYVAGVFLVECESPERAIEIAARIPEADMARVEVRPVISLSDFEI